MSRRPRVRNSANAIEFDRRVAPIHDPPRAARVVAGLVRPPLRAGWRVIAERFWALKDVSFEIKRGETVGADRAQRRGQEHDAQAGDRYPGADQRARSASAGRTYAMLELGAGFHAELSGRDNIYLNGSIYGFNRRDDASQVRRDRRLRASWSSSSIPR